MAFDQSARRTFAADLVPGRAATNGVSLNGVLLQLARMVGPALAALAIDGFGFGWGLVATGVCTSVSVLALVAMSRAGRATDVSSASSRRSVGAGLRVVWDDHSLRAVLVMLLVTSTSAVNWNVLLPIQAGTPAVVLAASTAVVLGVGSAILVDGGAASLQLRVDRGMRGRIMGMFPLAVLGGVGLGAPRQQP